jgi:hypothetical protein
MGLPHVTDADRFAAEEVARLMLLIERVDSALGDGVVERRGRPRALIEHRRRLSSQLERWLTHFGLTPHARATWVRGLGGRTWVEEWRERLDARP